MLAFRDFSPGDQDKLDAMLTVLSRHAGHAIAREDLVARWTALVDELQAGHKFSVSDYQEGLEVRGILEEVGECLSEGGRQKLIRAVLCPDRLFLSLTVPVNSALSCAWWLRCRQSMVQRLYGGPTSLSIATRPPLAQAV